MVVVIPCFNEPDLIAALSSLWACERPSCAVEVIVVVNSSELAPADVLARNAETLRTGSQWAAEHHHPLLAFHCLNFPALPGKKAGVGLARKIGMDEALARLDM